MSKKPFDDAFKDLAEQDAEALLRLLDVVPPGATVTPLPREISIQALAPISLTRSTSLGGNTSRIWKRKPITKVIYRIVSPTTMSDYG